jgi:hypothetical protein
LRLILGLILAIRRHLLPAALQGEVPVIGHQLAGGLEIPRRLLGRAVQLGRQPGLGIGAGGGDFARAGDKAETGNREGALRGMSACVYRRA